MNLNKTEFDYKFHNVTLQQIIDSTAASIEHKVKSATMQIKNKDKRKKKN